jgi:hypothetical protein
MIMMRRSDVSTRNEWSNYTNWPYDYLPINIKETSLIDPNLNTMYQTGEYSEENQKDILLTLGILFDGTVREETRSADIYKYEQQYLTSNGGGFSSLSGMYCYNFCLHTDPFTIQPSGSINLSKYSKIELEITTITPTLNPNAVTLTICDPFSGQQIGVNKAMTKLYNYTYDLMAIEERYNILTFIGGNASLMHAR